MLPKRPPIVLAEENKIRQVVTNLMGNAMRFTAYDDPIEIGIGVDDDRGMAHIDVIDHGEGIPPQLREKIFQRFWRADTSRARDTGGSGLGLAIVSGIVAAHGGSVEVIDTPGGGATFRIWLPLLPRDWAPTPAPEAPRVLTPRRAAARRASPARPARPAPSAHNPPLTSAEVVSTCRSSPRTTADSATSIARPRRVAATSRRQVCDVDGDARHVIRRGSASVARTPDEVARTAQPCAPRQRRWRG